MITQALAIVAFSASLLAMAAAPYRHIPLANFLRPPDPCRPQPMLVVLIAVFGLFAVYRATNARLLGVSTFDWAYGIMVGYWLWHLQWHLRHQPEPLPEVGMRCREWSLNPEPVEREPLTQRDRHLLAIRFMEIEAEISWIAEGRVVDGDPARLEEQLLDELEEIEFRLGETYWQDATNEEC